MGLGGASAGASSANNAFSAGAYSGLSLAYNGGYIPEYDTGGYTGDGGKYEPKGIVHGGEFVFTKEATQRIGVANLYDMMRGYAGGGLVSDDVPAGGMRSVGTAQPAPAPAPQVTINISSDGSQSTQATQGYEQFGQSVGLYVQQEYQKLRDRDLRPGGAIHRAMKGR